MVLLSTMVLRRSILIISAILGLVSVKAVGGVGRERRWCAPSFLTTQKTPPQYYYRNVLQIIRGGSSEEDDSTVSTSKDVNSSEVVEVEDTVDGDGDTTTADVTNDEISNENTTETKSLIFPATTDHDGSSDDPDGIPTRFLLMKKGDREGAKEAFESTLAWRKEFNVDTMLSRPHPKYDVCKALVPHYFAGEDPHGNIVFAQRPSLLDFELMKKNNATIDDLLMHYIYVIEYCWNVLEPGPPEGVMTNILDMRGISFRAMKNQEYIDFGKRFVNMMSENYPGRSYKTLVINAPRWFHALYKIFKPLLRESTREKIVILKAGEQQDTALKFYLGDCMPNDLISDENWEKPEPGSRWFLPLSESQKEECEPGPNSLMEFDMRQFCIEQLKAHNETIDEVL